MGEVIEVLLIEEYFMNRFFFFFWISNRSFIYRRVFHVHVDEHKVLESIPSNQ